MNTAYLQYLNNLERRKIPPHPAYRYGNLESSVPSMMNCGVMLFTDMSKTIQDYPLIAMSKKNRFDYYDFKTVDAKSQHKTVDARHFVDGFKNSNGPGVNWKEHIPEEIKTFLQKLLDNLYQVLVQEINTSNLGEKDKTILVYFLDISKQEIENHANTMLAMFSDEEWIWCPCNYLKHGWNNNEPDYLPRNYFTREARLNMVKHLEVELCERKVSDERFNYHFMYAVFIACIPNHRGIEIRKNKKIMDMIKAFVPEEEVFESVETKRMRIREKMIRKTKEGLINNPLEILK